MADKESENTEFKLNWWDGYLKLSHTRGQYEDGS